MGKRAQNRVKDKKPASKFMKSLSAKRAQKKPSAVRKNVPIIRVGSGPAQTSFKKPETTQMWQRVESSKILDRQACIDAFISIMRELENGSYAIEPGERDMGKYFVVHEPDRQGSVFLHVVPKEAYKIFKEMQRAMPTSFLGFSVLCGKVAGRPVRVSCFAIPTSEITRAMLSRK